MQHKIKFGLYFINGYKEYKKKFYILVLYGIAQKRFK